MMHCPNLPLLLLPSAARPIRLLSKGFSILFVTQQHEPSLATWHHCHQQLPSKSCIHAQQSVIGFPLPKDQVVRSHEASLSYLTIHLQRHKPLTGCPLRCQRAQRFDHNSCCKKQKRAASDQLIHAAVTPTLLRHPSAIFLLT